MPERPPDPLPPAGLFLVPALLAIFVDLGAASMVERAGVALLVFGVTFALVCYPLWIGYRFLRSLLPGSDGEPRRRPRAD